MSNTTYYRDGEGRFSPQVFNEIIPNATTHVWLKQQFGEPLWVDKAPNNVAVFTWQFIKEHHKRRDILLLLRYRTAKEKSEYLHVVLQDGVVVKQWQDVYEKVDVARVTYYLGLEERDKPAREIQNMMQPLSKAMPSSSGVIDEDANERKMNSAAIEGAPEKKGSLNGMDTNAGKAPAVVNQQEAIPLNEPMIKSTVKKGSSVNGESVKPTAAGGADKKASDTTMPHNTLYDI